MSDLISRQGAIDALMEFDKKLRKINWHRYPYTEHECRGVDKAIVKIANLPSAQPTQCNSSNVLRYPQCANRTKLGNCDPIGGFCTSVPKEMCDTQEHLPSAQAEPYREGDGFCSEAERKCK